MSVKREGRLKNAGAKLENGVKAGLIQAGMLVAQRAQAKAPRDTGRLKRSITRGRPYQTGSRRYAIDVGTNVIYAAVQEFGHTFQITDKQHRFFWAMYRQSLETMWRALALSQRYTVKPHPYLRPALNESRREIRLLILKSVIGALKRR